MLRGRSESLFTPQKCRQRRRGLASCKPNPVRMLKRRQTQCRCRHHGTEEVPKNRLEGELQSRVRSTKSRTANCFQKHTVSIGRTSGWRAARASTALQAEGSQSWSAGSANRTPRTATVVSANQPRCAGVSQYGKLSCTALSLSAARHALRSQCLLDSAVIDDGRRSGPFSNQDLALHKSAARQ